MYLIPFYVVDPELAARETRVINLLVEQDGLPVGSCGLEEMAGPFLDPLNPQSEHAEALLRLGGGDGIERFPLRGTVRATLSAGQASSFRSAASCLSQAATGAGGGDPRLSHARTFEKARRAQ